MTVLVLSYLHEQCYCWPFLKRLLSCYTAFIIVCKFFRLFSLQTKLFVLYHFKNFMICFFTWAGGSLMWSFCSFLVKSSNAIADKDVALAASLLCALFCWSNVLMQNNGMLYIKLHSSWRKTVVCKFSRNFTCDADRLIKNYMCVCCCNKAPC
jgi:hypothetical protein